MSDPAISITGGCLCGAVRYEANARPVAASYCHCRMCQKSVGNLFGVWVQFPRSAFRYTRGRPKSFPSSEQGERLFCAACGSPLGGLLDSFATVFVALGSLDHPEYLRPQNHWGIESKVPWVRIDEHLPSFRLDEDSDWTRPELHYPLKET